MNVIEIAVEHGLPYIIAILEIMGIIIVSWSAVVAFWHFIQNAFLHKNVDVQVGLAKGLATGLEFKMAAEILKTVLVRNMDELYILGAVILLRALLSILIHFEMKKGTGSKKSGDEEQNKKE
ncbi:MAG: DUF1622 domain-containing protein [Clostridia bacterium]|nr:DUF1622 domain-containing protein [Clostridia bacterium]